MAALNAALAGVNAEPERLHSRTAMVSAALARMFPINPAFSALGHPAATASPGAAPGSANVNSLHPAEAMLAKASVAVAFRYVAPPPPPAALITTRPL